MELEKIVSTILEQVGKTDVSKETVTTLVGLNAVPEGQEPDSAYFDKMVQAVRSVQGNVNNVMSTKVTEQVKAKVSEELAKQKQTQQKPPKNEGEGDQIPAWAKEMREYFENDRRERQLEKAEREKKNLLDSVRKGLEAKFDKGGLSLNSYFAKSALSRLAVPEKDADVKALVDEAERLYNEDLKEAGIVPDSPRTGGGYGTRTAKEDEHAWDDVARAVGRYRPRQNDNE